MARYRRITADQFEKCVEETMLQFARETSDNVVKSVHEAAESVAERVSQAITEAGIGGTEYKNSIEVRDERGRMKGKSTVWSPRHYRLTHLLENGHYLVYFGIDTNKRTRAFPHWAKANAEAEKILMRNIERAVQK